jgi:copper chaperone
MESRTIEIEGMSCGHCVARVSSTLEALRGVAVEDVRVGSARISFDSHQTTLEQIGKALDAIGFKLTASN